MRYISSHPHAFRNRIAKSIGVLVAAALVATLWLPSAAQAQTIGAKGVTFSEMSGLEVEWTTRFTGVDNWIVTFTKPNGEKVVVDQYTTNPEGQALGEDPDMTDSHNFTYDRNDVGTWWLQVDACFLEWGAGAMKDTANDETDDDFNDRKALKACPSKHLGSGTAVGYTHGPWLAPANLTPSMVPGGVALTWTAVKGDRGFVRYEYSQNAGDDDEKWTTASKDGAQVISVDPGDYTFSVRARGASDNDKNTDAADDPDRAESIGLVSSVTVTVPMPTPTLPEIAALFLAMLLLGSGAYLLRRRQSGGLTHA